MMVGVVSIVGFAGSLRENSYNRALLNAAVELVPEGASLEVFELDGIPLFNQDFEGDMPDVVKGLKSAVRKADALLIATPEYNYSVPGVLKNAIDWASRPYSDNSFDGKPVALMGASPGMFGTVRAQYHLRQVLVSLNMHAVNRPEVFVGLAREKFDASGNLTDEKTEELVARLLANLVSLAERVKTLD
jgi:chromate reductase